MNRTSFNDDWRVRPKVNAFLELLGGGAQPWVPVRLPHDAMIGGTRDPRRATAATATSPAACGSTRRPSSCPRSRSRASGSWSSSRVCTAARRCG